MERTQPDYARRRLIAAGLVLLVVVVVAAVAASLVDRDGDGTSGETDGSAATDPSSESPGGDLVALVAPPPCAVGEVVTESAGLDDWQQTIVDTERRLPPGYAPTDLVGVEAAEFEGEFEVRSFVLEDLAALRDAAAANGTPVELISAYRSEEFQEELFAERIEQIGLTETEDQLARPGHSEHQLGTTVDFGVLGSGNIFDESGTEAEAVFLAENAHRFGFVLSYPPGATETTCYIFEPWHFRYFGRDLARRIHDSGLTVREYLWHWQETGEEPSFEP